jgi:hypothetical protein
MIDVTQLTQEQQWGLSYATQLANETLAAENTGKAQIDQQPLLSDSQYAENVFRGACDSYYVALVEAKKKSALQAFDALPPEQQAALLAQLQVPDVLTAE